MNNIVTENKLDSIIFKYLDMKLEGIEKRKGKCANIVFAMPDEKYGLLGWGKTGTLYVSYRPSSHLTNFFGMELSDALKVIGRYVEDRYDLKVNYTPTLTFKIDPMLEIDTSN